MHRFGDVYYSGGSLTLKGATKIGLNSNGLKLASGTVAKASALTTGAEIYVDAEGIFTDSGANQTYFKPALRTVISAESTGLKAAQATSGVSGYCPHCNTTVEWTAMGATPAGHCYLTADISRTAAYSVTADTVIDLRGFDITSTDRAFTVAAGSALTLLDSVGGSAVKGSGNADKLGGIIQSAGALRIYGGNYTYVAGASKPQTSGGVIYATGAVYIHGGSFNATAFNNATDGKGGALYQDHNAGNFTMSAGYFQGGKTFTAGTMFIGGKTNTVTITGGHLTGGNFYTKGRLILDAVVFNGGKAITKGQDLYLDKSTVAHVTVGTGVTGTVSIAIVGEYLGGDTYGGPVTNTAATVLNAQFVLEEESAPLLCVGDGKLCVGAITVKKADGSEAWYSDTASAIAACPADGYVKLYTDATLELTKDCIVDLNGNTVTVSGDYTLYGMDSAGDDYSISPGKAVWASADKVKTQTILDAPNGNRYIPVTDGATVTYHRLGIQLTHVTIRPESCGIYYRGTWGCDSVLAERIEEYGIAVSLNSMPKEDFASDPDCLYASYAGTDLASGEIKTSVLVNGIMKSDLTSEDNQKRGEMPIYAMAYVKMKDGTVLTGDRDGIEDDIAFSLRGVMESMDHLIAAEPMLFLRPAVQTARDFYAQWKEKGMQTWRFDKLKEPEDDGILKIIILGSSRSVNTFQLLYEAFKDQMPDQEFVMGVMYYSGCSMTMHENFIKTNQPVYQYYHNSNGRWVITPGMYMADGLHAENWDVILLQAGTGDLNNQMQLETRNFLKGYIDDHVIDPYELWWHSTWFNSTDPTLYKPPKTAADAAKVDQIAQLTETNDAAKAYVLNDPMFSGHITSGTPMMYALKVLDVPEVDLFRDHTHLSDFGCLLVAYSFYAQYTGKPVTRINLNTIPVHLRHRDYQSLGDMTVTDEMKQIIIDTVDYTMNNLWAVPTGE